MSKFIEQLTAEARAHTGVTLCRSEDEERVEQNAREVAEQLEYDLYVWSTVAGLRCYTDPSRSVPALIELPDLLNYLINWTGGAALLVAHDIMSVVNHNESAGVHIARVLRTLVQLQRALNETAVDTTAQHQHMEAVLEQARAAQADLERAYNRGDEKALSAAVTTMRHNAAALANQYEIPAADRVMQLVLCDSEELTRPCGADAIEMGLPDRQERSEIVDRFVELREASCEDTEAVVDATAGLNEFQVRKALLLSLVATDELDPHEIAQYKRRLLQARGITWIDPDPQGFAAIGGLEPLKQWLRARALTFDREQAAQYGVEPAKGVIISGPPGVAKSRIANLLGTEWGDCPVIRLDIGATRQKFHGESERNLRQALRTIDAISPAGGTPCVVLIDEADRGLAGSTTSGELDGGVAGRVFQTLLTWMAERTSAAYLYLSSNHPDTIPSELTRSGRIDGQWWIDYPSDNERRAIIEIYKNRYRKTATVDIDALVERSKGRTGAEIEGAFREASIQALAAQKDQVTTLDVARALDILPCVKNTFKMTPAVREWKESAMKANDIEIQTLDFSGASVAGLPDHVPVN